MWGRRIIVGALAWVMLSAQAPEPKAEPQQKQSAAKAEPSAPAGPLPVVIVNQPADPDGYQDPCKGNEGDSRSDLCAQWTAAHAAVDAAYYAWIQLWATAVGMIGLLTTIYLTLKAVRAAQASVRVAQDTAKRQLRAYLTLDDDSLFSGLVVGQHIWFKPRIRNNGETPAREVSLEGRLQGALLPLQEGVLEPGKLDFRSKLILGKGQSTTLHMSPNQPLTQASFDEITTGRVGMFAFGKITYKDVFGDEWETHFRVMYDVPTGLLTHCEEGNEAT